MIGERLPGQALGRHEHERQRERATHQDEQRHPDLLAPEHPFRLRGVEAEPRLRRIGDERQRVQARHDHARDERLSPDQRMLAQQPQRAQYAAADAIQQPRTQARDPGDRIVGRAHLREAAFECFGHVDEMNQSGELVARDREAHAKSAVAERFRYALVDEDVIHATVGPLLLRVFEAPVRREVDVPVVPGLVLRNRPGRVGVERLPRLRLGNLASKSIRCAVRAKAHADLRFRAA
jgi:hypothetical protein